MGFLKNHLQRFQVIVVAIDDQLRQTSFLVLITELFCQQDDMVVVDMKEKRIGEPPVFIRMMQPVDMEVVSVQDLFDILLDKADIPITGLQHTSYFPDRIQHDNLKDTMNHFPDDLLLFLIKTAPIHSGDDKGKRTEHQSYLRQDGFCHKESSIEMNQIKQESQDTGDIHTLDEMDEVETAYITGYEGNGNEVDDLHDELYQKDRVVRITIFQQIIGYQDWRGVSSAGSSHTHRAGSISYHRPRRTGR